MKTTIKKAALTRLFFFFAHTNQSPHTFLTPWCCATLLTVLSPSSRWRESEHAFRKSPRIMGHSAAVAVCSQNIINICLYSRHVFTITKCLREKCRSKRVLDAVSCSVLAVFAGPTLQAIDSLLDGVSLSTSRTQRPLAETNITNRGAHQRCPSGCIRRDWKAHLHWKSTAKFTTVCADKVGSIPRFGQGTCEHAGVTLPLTGAQYGYSEDTARKITAEWTAAKR